MSPLENNDHPELDTSEELDEAGDKIFQSLIGSLQWAVSLARIGITTTVLRNEKDTKIVQNKSFFNCSYHSATTVLRNENQ